MPDADDLRGRPNNGRAHELILHQFVESPAHRLVDEYQPIPRPQLTNGDLQGLSLSRPENRQQAVLREVRSGAGLFKGDTECRSHRLSSVGCTLLPIWGGL